MRLPFLSLPLLVAALLLTACSRLTVENYDRLRVGMSYAEVSDILGKPDQCSDAMVVRTCRWGTDAQHASVNFVAGKAVVFSAEGLH